MMKIPIPQDKFLRRVGAIAVVLNFNIMFGWGVRFMNGMSGNWQIALFIICLNYLLQVSAWWWWYRQYQSLNPTISELVFRQSFLLVGFVGLVRGIFA